MLNSTVQGDCLEIIKRIPDNSVDLVIIDPPYIISRGVGGGNYGGNAKGVYQIDIEDKNDTLKEGFDFAIFNEYDRVCKIFHAYIFCNVNLLRKLLVYFDSDKYFIDILTVHKLNPIPTCNNKYLSDTEYILYVRKTGVPLYGDVKSKKKWFNINTTPRQFDHPTIKPLDIIETLITNSTLEGDTVLDTFAGSGTTGVACLRHNRNYIMCELDAEYIGIMETRLEIARKEIASKSSLNNFVTF
jgi:DNA modification methylase